MKGSSIVIVIVAAIAVLGVAFVFASGILSDKDYTIQYDMNGGIGSVNSQIVHNGDTFTVSECPGIKLGYKFDGWFFDDNLYTPGQLIKASSNFSFVASWSFSKTIIDSGQCGQNVFWALYDDGELEFAGSGSMYDWTSNNSSPWYGKTSIRSIVVNEGIDYVGSYAFYQCSNLKDVDLPSSLQSIGERTFNFCSGLTSVSMKKNITTIGGSCFEHCSALTSVYLPSSLKTIKIAAFQFCNSLEYVEFPSGLEYIGEGAFNGCTKLSLSTLPGSLIELGEAAFCDCNSLTIVNIPASVQIIGDSPFSCCRNLFAITVDWTSQYFESDNGILYDKGKTRLIQYPPGKTISEYFVPDTVKTICHRALDYASLDRLVLPSDCFLGELSLWLVVKKEVVIPEGVTAKNSFYMVFGYNFYDYDGVTKLSDDKIAGHTYVVQELMGDYIFVRSS